MQLYPFQQQVLDDTKDMNRVAYYYDMGLGKPSSVRKSLFSWVQK